MIDFIKNVFRIGPKVNFNEIVQNGATIIDVRTIVEYRNGHVQDSVNIPLHKLTRHIPKLSQEKPIITCCASGSRSAAAKRILKSYGFTEVHNGGSWMNLQNKMAN